jgi:hypothetical protein
VTFARQVFGEFNASRLQRNLPPSADFDLASAAERNHEVAAGRRMPIIYLARRRSMDFSARDLEHRRDLVDWVSGVTVR